MERLLEVLLYFDDTVRTCIWQTTDLPYQMKNITTGEIRRTKNMASLYHALYIQKLAPDVILHVLRKF